jgi:hypothetical protein
MPLRLRRVRGVLLRVVRRRLWAIGCGLALAVPGGWVQARGGAGAWWAEGLALVALATGIALIWSGLTGPRADWVE